MAGITLTDDQRQALCKRFGLKPFFGWRFQWKTPTHESVYTTGPFAQEESATEAAGDPNRLAKGATITRPPWQEWPAIDSDPRECEKIEKALHWRVSVETAYFIDHAVQWEAEVHRVKGGSEQILGIGNGACRPEAVCAAIWAAYVAGEFDE